MKSQVYQVISVLTIVLSFVPLLIVLLKKLWQTTPFQFYALYWFVTGVINIVLLIEGLDKRLVEVITVVYNAIDIPMMTTFLFLAATDKRLRKFIVFGLGCFLVFEIFCLLRGGLKFESLKYVLGVGVVLVLIIVVWQIILFLKEMDYPVREKALLFISASLLFQYGTYIVVYIFDYFAVNAADTMDKFLIYYISNIISLSISGYALLLKGLHKVKPQPSDLKRSFWTQSWERPVQ